MSEQKRYRIAVLPGDGIGQEVTAAAQRVLRAVAQHAGLNLRLTEAPVGGAAIELTGSPLPPSSFALAKSADAVLFGAVGDPRYDDPKASVRPEQALFGLRQGLGLFANLRPVRAYPMLADSTPLKPGVLQGTDLIVVRELTGGIYFGKPRVEGSERALDTMVYTRGEVERIAHVAFKLARQRRGKVTSVDKANVLACSRLWRATVNEVAAQYADVTVEHLLIDAATMHVLTRPRDFDVILTANQFGDILSDETSVLAGSMGMLPSASLGEGSFGLYEPIHGSAPDIAGRGIANPLAAILSVAMLLDHSLRLPGPARAVEAAVIDVLDQGHRTVDLAGPDQPSATTAEMADLVIAALAEQEFG